MWFPAFRALRRRGGGLRAYVFAAGGRWRNLVRGNARSFAAHMNSVRDVCATLPRTGARLYIPLPCAQMACDIRVFANGYDGCAFLNCGLVRGIQIPHPFSVSAGAIAFL